MKVKKLAEKLDDIAEDNPDAEVKIDPPFHKVRGIYYRERYNVVEIRH